ncbi:hypothetical protein HMN09_01224300 [Mycena chlorophos]|uniref:Gfd2/YDR514C-like C-terminal domain-containing protein n=1 Tax=Mycena chlorophos TaxID=658473 RepID=A0A8H6S4Q5_MYCCL|nr:hypothetical protein HMN09_01224300 [Mycena chlorophos]
MVNSASPVLTGYLRCSDILFHWWPSLKNTRDGVQLQKILERDSLLHPRHPLGSHEQGKHGIQAYIGWFHDGQARLLFSSAQVTYLLSPAQVDAVSSAQMQLTPNLIPLPYSDCMFLDSDLASIEPIVLEDLFILSDTSKKLGRLNTYLTANPLLVTRRSIFEAVRRLWAAKNGVWCALNVNAWSLDHTVILDVGWSVIHWDDGAEAVSESAHLVVAKSQKYDATRLEEGATYEFVTMSGLKEKLQSLFANLPQKAPIFVISTDGKDVMKYMRKQLQLPIDDAMPFRPDSIPTVGTYIVDPMELFNALVGRADHESEPKPLERVCKHLNVPFNAIRNAGEDSKTALDVVRSMATGPKVDAQREKRWPTQQEPRVQFQPWAEDPDYADLEGIMPPQK